MRLDKFLQVSRLVKRRTVANTLCSKGAVSVNGHVAKAGKMLAIGDVIRMPGASTTAEGHSTGIEEPPEAEYEVLELPTGNVSRARATTLYRQLNR
ncbi:RNA-binding protein [Candidatus Poribacteria bacterium]|nr:MAG: RNA-binding protein [Candidatus Poribacteria bacterium]